MAFKTYARKIHVYRRANTLDRCDEKWVYAWSTNATRTCKEAVARAAEKCPGVVFKANFAKD